MAVEQDETKGRNVMQQLLDEFREFYEDIQGEEPTEETMEEARKEILRRFSKHDRVRHREIYDELARE